MIVPTEIKFILYFIHNMEMFLLRIRICANENLTDKKMRKIFKLYPLIIKKKSNQVVLYCSSLRVVNQIYHFIDIRPNMQYLYV